MEKIYLVRAELHEMGECDVQQKAFKSLSRARAAYERLCLVAYDGFECCKLVSYHRSATSLEVWPSENWLDRRIKVEINQIELV